MLSSGLNPFTLHVASDWNSNHNNPMNKITGTVYRKSLQNVTPAHRRSFTLSDSMHFQVDSNRLRGREVLVGHLDQGLRDGQLPLREQHPPRLHGQSLDRVQRQPLEGGRGVPWQPGENQGRGRRRRLVLNLWEGRTPLRSGHQRRRLGLDGGGWD